MTAHVCPIKGCTARRREGHLMCLSHWRRVPKILQERVWETWRAVQAGRIEAVAKYREARDEALRVVT